MSTNFVGKGDVLNIIAPTGGYTSGQLVQFDGMNGVALEAAAGGELVAVAIAQEFRLPKVLGQAYARGEKVFAIAGTVTSVATGGTVPLGFTTEAAATGDATAVVKLNPF